MHINKIVERHINFCKRKKLPLKKEKIPFLIKRLQDEIDEVKEAYFKEADLEHTAEEVVDLILQGLQLLWVIVGNNIQKYILRKMRINNKRTWNIKT